MAIELEINGQTFFYPETGDEDWGPEATDWAVAVTEGMLQKAGGLFQLLANVDFGTTYGLISNYYTSRTANPASSGVLRLARVDAIAWRNNANTTDNVLTVNAADQLLYNGDAFSQVVTSVVDTDSIDLTLTLAALSADLNLSADTATPNFQLVTLSIESDGLKAEISDTNIRASISVSDTSTIDMSYTLGVITADIVNDSITNAMVNSAAAIAYSKLNLSNSIVNADVNTSAAIAYSKLNLSNSIVNADVAAGAAIAVNKLAALTASRGVVTDGSGFLAAATTTATEIGYVNGVTSAIQTQLDSKVNNSLYTALGTILAGSAANTPASVALGSDGDALIADSGQTAGVRWGPVQQQVAYIEQQEASGGNGGTFTSGAWQTRIINTLTFYPGSVSWVSLAGPPTNQFTLTAGTYDIYFSAPAYKVQSHKARLQDITNGTTIVVGSTELSTPTAGTQTGNRSFGQGYFTIAGSTVFEIQHRCSSTFASSGFGENAGFPSTNEVYTQVRIVRLA